jgi:hypothetical protein
MAHMPPLLEARGLVKRLGTSLVVNGVDLVCHAGQVVLAMLAVLVPLDLRLLRRRVLGD